MRIEQVPVVSVEDILATFEKSLEDYSCFRWVENDSYVYLSLDEDAIQELVTEIEFERGQDNQKYVEKYQNTLDLVHYFRSLGYEECILVYIYM